MVRYFEDYKVGEKIITPGRTIAEEDVSILMGITRNSRPVTIDEEDGKTTRLGGTIVQGRVALALVSGLILKSYLWTAK